MPNTVEVLIAESREAVQRGQELDEQQRRALLERVRPEHLDLDSRMQSLDRQKRYQCVVLAEAPQSDLTLFLVPQGRSIPAHDHPGMNVSLKVLWGKMRIRTYDWAQEHRGSNLARLVTERIYNGASEVVAVRPDQGNIHRLEALEDAAFVDWYWPPYSDACKGRWYNEGEWVTMGNETLRQLIWVP